MLFCTFSTFAQKIFKGWSCNLTWRFGKVMRIKSLKIVFVARIIRHKLCMIYAIFDFFCSKIIFDQNYFLTAEITLTSRGPLYIVLFRVKTKKCRKMLWSLFIISPIFFKISQNVIWNCLSSCYGNLVQSGANLNKYCDPLYILRNSKFPLLQRFLRKWPYF